MGWNMKLFNSIARFFSRDFPKPDKTVMTLEEITQYWMSLDLKWQWQCEVIIYRIRKPNDEKPNMWRIPRFFSPTVWMPSENEILQKLGVPGEINDPYTVRIIREWEIQPGISKKEEICIANFTLNDEC